jgi:hypothetical protein
MDTDTASLGTGRALGFQRALGTGVFGKVDHPTRHKGHFLRSRTADHLPFPIQGKGLLVKAFAFANRPSFAIHLQVVAAFPHQMAAQIGPVDVQFLQISSLSLQIRADRFSHTGFRDISWCEPHRTDETRVQVVEHMPLVSIHSHAPTFAPVAHLPIFHADAAVFGDPLDQAHLSLFADLHILLLDLFGNRQDRIGHSFVLLIAQLLDPGIYRVQHLQDQCQRLVFLQLLIPVPVQCCLQACATDKFCPRFLGDFGQLPPLLVCHHTHDLFERVSHQIIRIFHPSCSPQRATIQGGA